MKQLFVISILFFSTLFSFAQSATEVKVWEKAEALTKAIFETKDSAALTDLVSANVTYGHSGGAIEDKQQMIHKAVASKITYRSPSFEKLSINVQGHYAVLRHNFRATSVDEAGKETPLDLSILQVWKKEGSKWRIWARQAVKIPPKS